MHWPDKLTANLMDYRDDDSNVTVVDVNTSLGISRYYGFETPFIYISEIAESIIHYTNPIPPADTVRPPLQ